MSTCARGCGNTMPHRRPAMHTPILTRTPTLTEGRDLLIADRRAESRWMFTRLAGLGGG